MPPNRTSEVQIDFGAGMVRDEAPHRIDPRAAFDMVNVLLEEDASPYKRGGTENVSSAAFGAGLRSIWDGYFDAGHRTLVASPSHFGVLDEDGETVLTLASGGMASPGAAAMLEGLLFLPGGFIYGGSRKTAGAILSVTLTNGSAAVTGSGFSDLDAGMLMHAGAAERLYPVASVESSSALTLREPYEGTTRTVIAGFVPVYRIEEADPYVQSDIYAVCANRIVTADDETMRFSDVPDVNTGRGNPHVFDTNDRFEFPNGSRIIDFGVVGLTVLAFTTGGVWSYEGLPFELVDDEGNPGHRAQFLSGDIVLANRGCLASFSQALIAPCIDGVYVLDGVSSPRRVSRPIDVLYRTYIEKGYTFGGAEVFRGHLLLPVLSAASTRTKGLLAANLSRPITIDNQFAFPWTRLEGAGADLSSFAVSVPVEGGEPRLLGAEIGSHARIVDASGYFTPTYDNSLDADDTEFEWRIDTRDYETGLLTDNLVRDLAVLYELDDVGADPAIDFAYGYGQREDTTSPWDLLDWGADNATPATEDELEWGDDEDWFYVALDPTAGPDRGITKARIPVGFRTRYIRFRLRARGQSSVLRLRSLQVEIRPSEAVRR